MRCCTKISCMAVWAKIGIDIVNFYLKPELNVNVFCLTKLNLGRQREGARENQFESCESTSGPLRQLTPPPTTSHMAMTTSDACSGGK